MPEPIPLNFEIPTSGKGFALVADVLQFLLETCAGGRAGLHEDMDRLESRSAKNQIRNWVADFLSLGLWTPDAFDVTAIDVFNTLLRNERDIRHTVTRLQENLGQYIGGDRLRDAGSVTSLRGFIDCLPNAFHELAPDQPFPCGRVTIARAIAQGIDDGFGSRLGLAFRSAAIARSALGSDLRELTAGEVFLSRRFNPKEKSPFFCR
ncbi:MAG: hypothetical protein J0M17_24525, partial [Planctomycetes bacterium]|nr:hypothetical protein [Planctomycetota bacterium]